MGMRQRCGPRVRTFFSLFDGFQGLCRRKNNVPVGEVMVILLVSLAVERELVLAVQPAVAARLLFCCKVKLPVSGQETMTLVPAREMLRFGTVTVPTVVKSTSPSCWKVK